MEWNATITDMKFHFKNNAFRTTTITLKVKWKRRKKMK